MKIKFGASIEEEREWVSRINNVKHTSKLERYYFLDFRGDVKLTIKNNFIIECGFHDGEAVISTSGYGVYSQLVIDKDYHIIDGYDEVIETDDWDDDKDDWYAMTDGMYGDYPEEGFDGDYESIGF